MFQRLIHIRFSMYRLLFVAVIVFIQADTTSSNQTTTQPSSTTQGRTYWWSTNPVGNWSTARQWCQEHYTDMVSVLTREEYDYLNQIVPTPASYWIGIRKVNGVFTWVETGENVTAEAANWASGEPNDYGGVEDCVEIYIKQHAAGKWNDQECTDVLRTICYRDITSSNQTTPTTSATASTTTTSTTTSTTAGTGLTTPSTGPATTNTTTSITTPSTAGTGLTTPTTGPTTTPTTAGTGLTTPTTGPTTTLTTTGPITAPTTTHTTTLTANSTPATNGTSLPITTPPPTGSRHVIGLRMGVSSKTPLTHEDFENIVLPQLKEELVRRGIPPDKAAGIILTLIKVQDKK